MGVDIMRQQLLALIEQGDDKFVRVLYAVSTALNESTDVPREVVGYSTDTLDPIYSDEMADTFDAIVERVKGGDFITLEALETEMESW